MDAELEGDGDVERMNERGDSAFTGMKYERRSSEA
jgi:hypothetical protein